MRMKRLMAWAAMAVSLMLAAGGCDDTGGSSDAPVCGDGKVQGIEECDSGILAGRTCRSFGYRGGFLNCSDTCRFDFSQCIPMNCGDGYRDEDEECDGSDLPYVNCTDFGYDDGLLGCLPNCKFDFSQCLGGECGNGVKEYGEECDGTDFGMESCATLGFASGQLRCTEDCRLDTSQCKKGDPVCGNGVREAGEECDGVDLGDATSCKSLGYYGGMILCTSDCRYDFSQCEAYGKCGDGRIQAGAGEECDLYNTGGYRCTDFGYTGGTLGCTRDCRFDFSTCDGTGLKCEDGDGLSCTYGSLLDGRCVGRTVAEGWCVTDEGCVQAGDRSSRNECLVCDPSRDQWGWSAAPRGTECDDGIACNGTDTCDGSGVCSVHQWPDGLPPACVDGNECTEDACVETSSGYACYNDASSRDGQQCATTDGTGVCSAGICIPQCEEGKLPIEGRCRSVWVEIRREDAPLINGDFLGVRAPACAPYFRDGMIHCAGGTPAAHSRDHKAFLWQGSTSQPVLVQLDDLPSDVVEAVAVPFDESVWLIGGRSSMYTLSSVWIWSSGSDPLLGQWHQGPSLPTAVRRAAALPVGQDLVVCGGILGLAQYRDTCYLFSGTSRQWFSLPSLPSPLASFTLYEDNGTLLAFGGMRPSGRQGYEYSTEIYAYAMGAGSWSVDGTVPEELTTRQPIVRRIPVEDVLMVVGAGPSGTVAYLWADGQARRVAVWSNVQSPSVPSTRAVEVEPYHYIVPDCFEEDGYHRGCSVYLCPFHSSCGQSPDTDGDGLLDTDDNCPATYNPGQEDWDGDGMGDACDPENARNVWLLEGTYEDASGMPHMVTLLVDDHCSGATVVLDSTDTEPVAISPDGGRILVARWAGEPDPRQKAQLGVMSPDGSITWLGVSAYTDGITWLDATMVVAVDDSTALDERRIVAIDPTQGTVATLMDLGTRRIVGGRILVHGNLLAAGMYDSATQEEGDADVYVYDLADPQASPTSVGDGEHLEWAFGLLDPSGEFLVFHGPAGVIGTYTYDIWRTSWSSPASPSPVVSLAASSLYDGCIVSRVGLGSRILCKGDGDLVFRLLDVDWHTAPVVDCSSLAESLGLEFMASIDGAVMRR